MFNRFKHNAKRVMNETRVEAQRLGHDFLDVEHVVLGLLRVPECTAMRVLQAAHCEAAGIRSRIEAELAAGKTLANANNGQLPFTPRAKKALELSMETAGALGDDYIGTEHLLVGCALTLERDEKGKSETILGADPERLHSLLHSVDRSRGKSSESSSLHTGAPARQLRAAGALCDVARERLVQDGKFDEAARLRDIAYSLTKLADGLEWKGPKG